MSRQARKEAAAAAQDLLKVDAARVRKATAQTRKDAEAAAPVPMRKAQGRPRVPLVSDQSSSGWAARVPEQRNSGYGTATPPRSFTDGSCFFNGSAGGFFGSAGQSPVTQPWNSQSSDPATWGNNATPHGGFTNLIQPNMSRFTAFKPPQSTQEFHSEEDFSTPISARDNTYVNVDSGDEAPRTEK
ncbi:unnamed protein product [Urochloa humidicola]